MKYSLKSRKTINIWISPQNESTLQDEDIESDEDGRDTDHTQESIVNQRSCSRDSDRQEFEMMARQELQTSQRSQSSSNGFEVDDQTEKDQKNLSQGTASHQNSEENMVRAGYFCMYNKLFYLWFDSFPHFADYLGLKWVKYKWRAMKLVAKSYMYRERLLFWIFLSHLILGCSVYGFATT